MDKRVERTIAAGREAALKVLARSGFASFTMEAVAEESGIAKSTLYRQWPNRMALLTDALDALNQQPGRHQQLQTTDFRGQVLELTQHLAAALDTSLISRVIPALIEAAEHHPEVSKFLRSYSYARRGTLVDLLKQGIELGELNPAFDAELAALSISGPIFYCRYLTSSPFPIERVPDLVALVLGPRPER